MSTDNIRADKRYCLPHFLGRKAFLFRCFAGTTAVLGLDFTRQATAQTPLSDDAVRSQGRSAVALVARKNSAALFARFNPEMARGISQKQLLASLDPLISDQAPLGKVITESIREEGGGVRAYIGEYQWRADHSLTLTFDFAPGSGDEIAGMRIRPAIERKAVALNIGRNIVALIAARDAKSLLARSTPEFSAMVPELTLQGILNTTLTEKSPLGPLVSDRIDSVEGNYLRYSAEYIWRKENEQNLAVVVTFEAGGANRIAGATIRPALPKKLQADPKADYKQKSHLMLPFAPGEEWYVVWGGTTRSQNYHVDYPDQRHAFDLVIRKNGKTHPDTGKENTDYYAWGKTIVAPAVGTVVEAVNDLPDNKPGRETDTKNAAGNHVVLDLGNSEYLLLAHLQNGSIRVKAGDTVKPGDALGLCGNSGNTSEPHLHIHLQDRPALLGEALGLPMTFSDYTADGKKTASGSPIQGQTIKQP